MIGAKGKFCLKGTSWGFMVVYTDIEELMTMKRALAKGARFIEDKDLSLIPKAALVIDRGVVKWVGPQVRLPGAYRQAPKKSLEGLFVFPGFVDCHTHLVFFWGSQVRI